MHSKFETSQARTTTINTDKMCPFSNESSSQAQKLRREFRRQQVELMELTALGLNRGTTIEDLDCLQKMEQLNLELSSQSRDTICSCSSRSQSSVGRRVSLHGRRRRLRRRGRQRELGGDCRALLRLWAKTHHPHFRTAQNNRQLATGNHRAK